MSKARTLANLISDNAELADGQISVAEVVGAAPLANPSFTGNITVSGNVDGRDIAADGTKLDGVEASADVTDASNVTAAGALMDSELTNIAAIKALNQGVATTDEVAFDNTTLNAIAKDISDTAVDVFVYDTSKDSDGGAWRKRTQHTSWYNETLNTATRGSRKEFPAVAVIVAESSQVTIYDGDDPDMPMWMVFNAWQGGAAAYHIGGYSNSGNFTSVIMLNGELVTGSNGGAFEYRTAVSQINFIKEKVIQRRGTQDAVILLFNDLADRNNTAPNISAYDLTEMVNGFINDLAMTVLPNAPIDSVTGLPVPTIAVATDGGVSVIKDDGTVVDITYNSSTWAVTAHVAFGKDNQILFCTNSTTSSSLVLSETPIPTADVSFYEWEVDQGYYERPILGRINTSVAVPNFVAGGYIKNFATYNDEITTGSGSGATKVVNGPDNRTNLFNYTTSSYNTGWMNGDIKLATLSDTDDTDVTGAELVTNGTFDSNTSGWTEQAGGGSSIAVVSGELQVTGGTTSYPRARQEFTTVVGQKYVVSATARQGTTSNNVYIYNNDLGASNITYHSSTTNAELSFTFTASSTTSYVELTIDGISNGTTAFFDNISVRLAEEDRSVNGNGLQVFGTVTKNPVATGADLVGYSGFSSSNYLLHPINTMGINWSTEWSLMFWSLDQGFCVSLEAQNTSSYNNTVLMLFNDATNFVTRSHNANYNVELSGGVTGIHHIAAVYRNGRIIIYQDGVSIYDNTSNGISNLNVGLSVGARTYNNTSPYAPANQKLALLKVSGTNPSPEQIAKIYNDEKVLFQENAQATLYGTSDAVTALAHDDTTNLLHVGTSAGRSVFQGLRRVENTTDAVGATISASNGLVAED